MKKRNLFTSGLSVMLLLGMTNTAMAQDDTDDTEESTQLEFEHAEVNSDLAEVVDVLDIIELAREEFEGVVTELDFDDYDDGYYYEVDMASDSEEFYIQFDAVTLEPLELDREDSEGFFDDGELDEKYVAKLNGDIASIEEAVESTREYFDGIITDFDVEEDDGVILYQFTIEDDHLELDIDINAEDLSVVEYEIDTKDDDSEEHQQQIDQNIQEYDPEATQDDDDDDDLDEDNDDDDDLDDDDLDDDDDDNDDD